MVLATALVAWTIAWADDGSAAALAHRWSFTRGSLADAVEQGLPAWPEGAVKASAEGRGVQLPGGPHGTSTLSLGEDLLPADGLENTMKMMTNHRRAARTAVGMALAPEQGRIQSNC